MTAVPEPQTYPVPIRRRTLPETLAYLSRDLIEHPGKYEPLALSILLDQLAQQARDEHRASGAFQWRITIDGHPDSGCWIDVADGDFQNLHVTGRLEFRAKPAETQRPGEPQ
jgi:hypothetical protein